MSTPPQLLENNKVRITSKKTGKEIDINVDFTKKINTNYLNKGNDMASQETKIGINPSTLANEEKINEIINKDGKLDNPFEAPSPGSPKGGGTSGPGFNLP